jgi:DNA-binding transcriptional MerR regulator
MESFTETSSAIGRASGMTPATVNKYADLGLLDFIRASDGTRLFRAGQEEKVREIHAERMRNRGSPRTAA